MPAGFLGIQHCRVKRMSSDNLRFLKAAAITAPTIDEIAPGKLHTVVQDADDNIYYSDEFAHRVVSLNRAGALRWHRSGKGNAPGQFWYPLGISIGWVTVDSERRPCIAICDSWNRRVQMLDLDGCFLCQWNRSGSLPLSEPASIRFISDASDRDGSNGFWLLLDRGNHRIYAIDQKGEQLFQSGSAFPPRLSLKWFMRDGAGLSESIRPDKSSPESLVYDPLYYPTAILGKSERSLFIYEPSSGKLKQLLWGNLFPLSLSPADAGIWIAADENGLLSWSVQSQRVSRYNRHGDRIADASLPGIPVASDLPSHAVWIQNGDALERWIADAPAPQDNAPWGLHPLLFRTMTDELAEIESGEAIPAGVHSLLDFARDLAMDARALYGLAKCNRLTNDSSQRLRARAAETLQALRDAAVRLSAPIHNLSLALMKVPFLCEYGQRPDSLARALERWHVLSRPLQSCFEELRQQYERFHTLLWSRPMPSPGVDHRTLFRYDSLDRMQDIVQGAMKELCNWPFISQRTLPAFDRPTEISTAGSAMRNPALWIQRSGVVHQSSRYLREVGRMSVWKSGGERPDRLNSIVRSANGHLFAAFLKGGVVARLDGNCSHVCNLGGEESANGPFHQPTSLAMDADDRLWIVSMETGQIHIYDQPTGTITTIGSPHSGVACMSYPAGICRGPGRSMLVTDYGKHRIVVVNESGFNGVFGGRFGAGLGEFKYPVSIIRDSSDSMDDGRETFFVVDQMNHRIQQLDSDGNALCSIGTPGVGPHQLMIPDHALRLPGGDIVVSQKRFTAMLKVFTDGCEVDSLPLDYAPGCMVVHNGLLLVAEWCGGFIRAYEYG